MSKKGFNLFVMWVIFEVMSGGVAPSLLYALMHLDIAGHVQWQEVVRPQDLILLTGALAFARIPSLALGPTPVSTRRTALIVGLICVAVQCTMLGTAIRLSDGQSAHFIDLHRMWFVPVLLIGAGLGFCTLAIDYEAESEPRLYQANGAAHVPSEARRSSDAVSLATAPQPSAKGKATLAAGGVLLAGIFLRRVLRAFETPHHH